MAEKTTREHLVEVGVKLMHEHGYTATGLKEILASAEVPKGSFYHYFGSKEEFAAAVLESYVAREGEHCAAVLSDARVAPLKRLRQYFNELIKIYGQKGAIPGCMMGRFSLDVAGESVMLRKLLSSSFGQWQQGIASVLVQAKERKELPAGADPRSLADFFLNSWEGALLRSQAEKSDDPLKDFMHYAFDVLLKSGAR